MRAKESVFRRNARTQIPAHYFTCKEVFQAEQERLFAKTWQLFCLQTDLQSTNDFVSGEVAGQPVVVQRTGEKVSAFHNICSHRYSPVQTEPCGNRPLRCPYHGWQYDGSGYPAAIPHNLEFYPISVEEKRCLGLPRHELESCGRLQFVRVGGGEQSLHDYLGEWATTFEQISNSFDDIYFQTRFDARCNWKFLVHNLFDDIHAEFVHPSSSLDTSSYLGTSWKFHPFDPAVEDIAMDCSRRHAVFNVEITPEAIRSSEQLWQRWFPQRGWRPKGYFHSFIYPNVMLTSFLGFWFNIVHYRPISPDRTEITMWLVPTRQTEGAERIEPNMLHSLALSSLRIFNEDVQAVETSQAGMRASRASGILGQREDKILAFETAYMSLMKGVLPP
jgi:phenylpropionate dioxygenase-like ring-hydroxylating dioxygenase large terminal subunit